MVSDIIKSTHDENTVTLNSNYAIK